MAQIANSFGAIVNEIKKHHMINEVYNFTKYNKLSIKRIG